MAVAAQSRKKRPGRFSLGIRIAAITLLLAIVVGAVYYVFEVLPFQRVILTVGDTNVKTSYFLRRVVANIGGDASSTLQQLVSELIIAQQAASLGIPPASEQDIDAYLRDLARGDAETISDADYDTWLKERLMSTGLKMTELREIVGRAVLRQRLLDLLGASIQTDVPQIHLWALMVSSEDAALKAKARIDGGESFSDVAKDVSLATTAKDDGGDQGWVPVDLLEYTLGSQVSEAASGLDIGKVSDPVPLVQQSSVSSTGYITRYLLLYVSEKAASRAMTDDQINIMEQKALSDWLTEQESTMKIAFHGLNGATTLDSQTQAWIDLQVQRLLKKLPSETSTVAATETMTPATETTVPPSSTEPATTTPSTASGTASTTPTSTTTATGTTTP
jgi:parvulin-like peptidyl-prolyl isomerase